MDIHEEIDSLSESGFQNSKIGIALSSAIRELQQDWGRSPESIRADIEAAEVEHPFSDYIINVSRWIESKEYENGAEPALANLRDSIDLSLEEGWNGLVPILLVERINLLGELSHTNELEAELRLAIEFLLERGEGIAIGRIFDLLDSIVDNVPAISSTASIERLFDYAEELTERLLSEQHYTEYRKVWERILKIREYEGLDNSSIRGNIINSYNLEIKWRKSDGNHSLRAMAAKEAIFDCDEWVDESQRTEWEEEFIQGNKESIKQMAEITHSPSDDEINELDEAIENLIDGFKEQKRKRSPSFAIKWLLNHNFVPDIERAKEISEPSILDIVQQRSVSEAGESYSKEESTGDYPHSYGAMVQFLQNVRQTIYYRLQNRGLLKESELFILFGRREVLSANSQAYLTDFIIHLFEHDHPAAVHLGVAQLEAVIRELAAANDKSVLRKDEETGEMGRRPMGGLLFQIEDEVEGSWITYLRYWYTELSGQNVRNKISHGYLPYKNASWGMSVIILFDILQNFLEFEKAYGGPV